jgi:CHAT domain-containing protein
MIRKLVGIKFFECVLVLILTTRIIVSAIELPSHYQNKLLVPEPVINSLKITDEASHDVINNLRLTFYLGDSLFVAGQLSASCIYYEKALQSAQKLNLNQAKIICYNRIGFARYWLNQLELSRLNYSKSLTLIKKENDISDTLACLETYIFYRITDNEISPKETESFDSLFFTLIMSDNSVMNLTRRAKYYFIRSGYALYNDNYNLLKSELVKFREVVEKDAEIPNVWLFYYRYFQAGYYDNISDFPLAKQYYLGLQKQVDDIPDFYPYKYLIYLRLCGLYKDYGLYHEAAKYIDRVFPFIRDKQNSYYCYDFLQIGYVYEMLGNNTGALSCYNRARSILNLNRVEDNRLVMVDWYLASYHRSVTHDVSKQLYYLNQAMQILDRYPDDYLESFIVSRIGALNIPANNEKAIALLDPYLNNLDRLLNDEKYFREQCPFIIRSDYSAILNDRGKAYFYLSKKKSNDTLLLQKSYSDYQKALKLSIKIYNEAGFEDSKIFALNDLRKYYNDVFNVGYTLYQYTGNKAILPALFTFSEDSKASLLKSFLTDGMRRKISGISDEELQHADRLKMQIDTLMYFLSLQQKNNLNQSESFLIDRVLERSKAYDDYLSKLATKYPKYASMKLDKQDFSIAQIRSRLDTSQVLIEYFFTHNAFYTFYFSCDTFGIDYQPIQRTFPSELLEYKQKFENFTYDDFDKQGIDSFAAQSYSLYRLAIKPIEKLIRGKSLLIVTDAELGYIPFETLLTKNPDSITCNSFRDLPYLLRKNPISYLYSVAQLMNRSEQKHSRVSYAGFAPQYNGIADKEFPELTLQALPGAVEEIMAAKKYYRNKIFLGEKVKKEKYFQAIRQNDIVHLAMHTVTDAEEPRRSMLLFSRDRENDKSQLHTFEIYSNEIRSALVVLSACNTGTGKMNKGEGIFSIARSFLLAGIRNVIYTQWSVTDRSSAQLMKYFYMHLSEGDPVDRALQRAKIDFVTNGDPAKAHPYYWAGYVSMGIPVCLPANRSHSYLYLLIGLCILVLVLLVIRKLI